MTAPAVDMQHAHDPAQDRAATLVRRQLVVTALGIVLVLVMMAFVKSQELPSANDPVSRYVQAHQPPPPANESLAYLHMGATAVVAVVALGHAAHVVAFVFRRKVF